MYLNEEVCEIEVLELSPVMQHFNREKTLNVEVGEKKDYGCHF